MEFVVSQKVLEGALARVRPVVGKSSMPILTCVLITAERADTGGIVRIAGTDLRLSATAAIQAMVPEAGACAVAARALFDIVKSLPAGDVTWTTRAHDVEIKAGKARFRLPALPATDFVAMPAPAPMAHEVSIDAAVLGSLIAQVERSVSNDDTRPHLAGALLEIEGASFRCVSTDGHRMSLAIGEHVGKKTALDRLSAIVPRAAMRELARMCEAAAGEHSVRILRDDVHAFFCVPGLTIAASLINDQFPPYERVIPKEFARFVVVNREDLVAAMRRATLFAKSEATAARFVVGVDLVRVLAEDADIGDATEMVDAKTTPGCDPEFTIGVSARYMLDALDVLDGVESVRIEMGGELDPIVVRPVDGPSYTAVVMPMRR